MFGCGSMKVVVGWIRGSRDAYSETYEVDDEELLEEVDNDPDSDPNRDLAYYVRKRGGFMCATLYLARSSR